MRTVFKRTVFKGTQFSNVHTVFKRTLGEMHRVFKRTELSDAHSFRTHTTHSLQAQTVFKLTPW
jgi:hypothetical protein